MATPVKLFTGLENLKVDPKRGLLLPKRTVRDAQGRNIAIAGYQSDLEGTSGETLYQTFFPENLKQLRYNFLKSGITDYQSYLATVGQGGLGNLPDFSRYPEALAQIMPEWFGGSPPSKGEFDIETYKPPVSETYANVTPAATGGLAGGGRLAQTGNLYNDYGNVHGVWGEANPFYENEVAARGGKEYVPLNASGRRPNELFQPFEGAPKVPYNEQGQPVAPMYFENEKEFSYWTGQSGEAWQQYKDANPIGTIRHTIPFTENLREQYPLAEPGQFIAVLDTGDTFLANDEMLAKWTNQRPPKEALDKLPPGAIFLSLDDKDNVSFLPASARGNTGTIGTFEDWQRQAARNELDNLREWLLDPRGQQSFIQQMQSKGPSQETVGLLLDLWPDITREQVDEIFAPPPIKVDPEAQKAPAFAIDEDTSEWRYADIRKWWESRFKQLGVSNRAFLDIYKIPQEIQDALKDVKLEIMTEEDYKVLLSQGVDAAAFAVTEKRSLYINPGVTNVDWAELIAHETGHLFYAELTSEQKNDFWDTLNKPEYKNLRNAIVPADDGHLDLPNEAYATLLAKMPQMKGIPMGDFRKFYPGIDLESLQQTPTIPPETSETTIGLVGKPHIWFMKKETSIPDYIEMVRQVRLPDWLNKLIPDWSRGQVIPELGVGVASRSLGMAGAAAAETAIMAAPLPFKLVGALKILKGMEAVDRAALAQKAGLSFVTGAKDVEKLTRKELTAMSAILEKEGKIVITKTTKAIPKAEVKPTTPSTAIKGQGVEAAGVKEGAEYTSISGNKQSVSEVNLGRLAQVKQEWQKADDEFRTLRDKAGRTPAETDRMNSLLRQTDNLVQEESKLIKASGATAVQPPSPAPKSFSGVNISTVDELQGRITGQKIGGKAGKVLQVPGVKQVGKIVNPIAVSDDPGTVLASMSGMIDDQINGGMTLAMSKPLREMNQAGKLFNLDATGTSLAQDIKQLKPLPNGQNSMAMHDIIEFAPWYDFGTGEVGNARRQLVQTIRDTSEQMGAMLRKEGILVDGTPGPGQIKAMKGENGWSFLHRVVNEVKEEAADSLARNLVTTLKDKGIPFTKQAKESNYQFLARFAEDVKAGKIAPSDDVNQLLERFGDLADVKVKKNTLEAKRSWDTVAEGLKAGITYEPNPIAELQKQVRASYQLVKRKRLGEAVTKLLETTTPIEKASAELGIDYAKTTQAKVKADTLVSYLQRAIRGESLPGGAITEIRKSFPDIAAKLEKAMEILPAQRTQLIKRAMREAANAAKVTGTDAEAIAKRTQTLADIKTAFQELGTKPNITRGDIVEVIQQTINDKTAATRAVRQTLADMNDVQKVALKDILAEAKVLTEKNAAALKQVDDLAAKFNERMGPLGTAEYGRIPGVPGMGNRVIVPQRGKLGQEIADEVRQHFGYLPKSGADKAVEAAGLVGGAMRMFRLGFDLSATMIQQVLSLGYDIRNLATLKPTAVWAKATGGAVRAGISRNVDHLEGFLINNADIVKDYIQRGGLIESAEFTEAAGPLRGLLAKIPNEKIQIIADAIGKHVLGRFDAVFTTGRVEAAVNMYKAGYKAMERAGKLDEWARLTNNMTGVLSTRAMGIGSSQRNIESALAFMSPRFTRANAAILFDILTNPKGYTAKEAGTALAALIGAGTAIYLAGNAAQGNDSTLNPFDPDFGNLRVGERVYRFGGIMSDLRRVLTAIDAAVYATSGERLSLSGKDDRTLPLDKLGFQMFQTKSSPITGTAIDAVRMLTDKYGIEKDYQGRPLSWKNILGNWTSPSWSDALLNNEPDVILGTGGQFIGLNTYVPYTGNWKDSEKKLGLLKNEDSPDNGLIPLVYGITDYWGESASQFKGVDPATLTEAKGYSPKVKAMAETLVILDRVKQYPNKTLASLNSRPVDNNGKRQYTFLDYSDQWGKRLNLVAAGKDAEWTDRVLQPDGSYKETTYKGEKALSAFDKKFPQANQGNFSLRQKALLRQLNQLSPDDTKGREQFIKDNFDEIGINPTDKYWKEHPTENAMAALHGQAQIYSAEAYAKTMKLARDLDYPDNLIPPLKYDGDDIPKDEETRKAFFEYQEVKAKYNSSDTPEAHVLLLKNPKLYDLIYPNRQKVDVPAFENKPLPALEIQVKNRKLNDEYAALTSEKDKAAFDADPTHKNWLEDKMRVTAYEEQYRYDNTIADKKIVEAAVEYGKKPEGNERTLFRVEDPAFDAWGQKVYGWKPLDPNLSVDKLKLQVKNKAKTEAYNALPTPAAKASYLLKDKEYAKDRLKIEGFNKTVPSKLIEQYVEYYSELRKDYEDDWYLIEHPEFYRAMAAIEGGAWKQRDFSKVPSKMVWSLYQQYLRLPDNVLARQAFRMTYPNLNQWLIQAKGYEPIKPRTPARVTAPSQPRAQPRPTPALPRGEVAPNYQAPVRTPVRTPARSTAIRSVLTRRGLLK